MISSALASSHTVVTAMLSGMKRRTRNGCRNFMRVMVSNARAMMVMNVSHGAGDRI